jgi:peptidoglycan/xylan/chitin deacetylase (PgdA/CDA1 family)
MNILTFDIEDWYNVDFISEDFHWDRHEVRIYEGVDRILERLEKDKIKATFFCLGWLAEKHPEVIRRIDSMGHHIGCHSYQHQLAFRFTPVSSEQILIRLVSSLRM